MNESGNIEEGQKILDAIYLIGDDNYQDSLAFLQQYHSECYRNFIFESIQNAAFTRPYYNYLYADLWIALRGKRKLGSTQSFFIELLRRKNFAQKLTGNVIKNSYEHYSLEELLHGSEDNSDLANVLRRDDVIQIYDLEQEENFDKILVNKNSLIDASISFGAEKCFDHFMSKNYKFSDKTANASIIGGSFEIFKQLREKKITGFIDLFSKAIRYHHNNIAMSLIEEYSKYDNALMDSIKYMNLGVLQKVFEKASAKTKTEAFTAAAENNDIFSLNFMLTNGCPIPEDITSAERLNLDIVKLLESHGCDFMKHDEGIIRAVYDGNIKLVDYLIGKGANVNAKDNHDCSLIVRSCIYDLHLPVAKLLVEHGADIEEKDSDGFTPLLKACSMNLQKTVSFLIENGADVNKTTSLGETALMLATNKGADELIELLLDHGCNIHARDNKSNTAFFHAVKHHNMKAIECLIKHGSKIDEECEDGMTPIMISTASLDLLKFFDEKKCDLTHASVDGLTTVLYAAKNGFTESLKYLKSRGANFSSHDNKGRNILHMAAMSDEVSTIDYLLTFDEFKQIINESDKEGNSPIFYCNKENIVRSLIRSGADMEHRNANNDTPLFYHLLENRLDIAKYLIKNGSNTVVKNNQGPLIAAAAFAGMHSLVQKCINDGAFVDSQTEKGNTALIYAAMNDEFQTVQFLGALGADINHKNKSGKSAIDYTESTSIEAYLKKRGAVLSTNVDSEEEEMIEEDGYYCTEIQFE